MEALREEIELQIAQLLAEGTVPTPHPYVSIWCDLRRYQQVGGWRPLPGPGGWLDQDAELMWALELCDRAWETQTEMQRLSRDIEEAFAGAAGAGDGSGPKSSRQAFSLSGSFE